MRHVLWPILVSLLLLVVNVFMVGCGEKIDYYDPSEASVVSNRTDALGLIQIMAPKVKEQIKSCIAMGRNDVAWELRMLFDEDVRSKLSGLVDVQLWNTRSNRFTKAGIDYVKAVSIDSRTPGMLSNFALMEYPSILEKIEDCIMSCKYSEAQEWGRYLQKIIADNRLRLRALGNALTYYIPNDAIGTNAQTLAWSFAGEPYYSKRMCPSMTLGQILMNPDDLLRQRVENFKKKGLDLKVVVAYYGENRPEEMKRLFDWFLPMGLELDGSLKSKEVKYRDDGHYINDKGEFSLLYNTVANTMARDLVRLYNTFETSDDIARFMFHLHYEFYYASDKEIVSRFNERYEFLMDDLQNLCTAGSKIDSTRAFKRIYDKERAERKAKASKEGER